MSFFSTDNIVFKLPHFDVNNYFTEEILMFLFFIAAVILGILLCFLGHRFLSAYILIGLGLAAGAAAVKFISPFLKDPILRMFVFVTFIFLFECLLLGITYLIRILIKKLHLRSLTTGVMVFLTSVLGFSCIFGSLYYFVYRGIWPVLVVSLVIAIAGFIFQHKKARMKREFFTYDDIYYDRR